MKKSRSTIIVFAVVMAVVAVWVNRSHADAPAGQYTIMNGTVLDTKTGLTWPQTPSPDIYNWSDAQAYCAGLDLQGMGWRAPSMKELQTLVDDSKTYNVVDTTVFPGTHQTYWTSTRLAGGGTTAWSVELVVEGQSDTDADTTLRHVWCVR